MKNDQESTIEPERDPLLRAALVDALGETPPDVDWSALAHRTRSAARFRLRARARDAAWWELAGKWSARALPIGALAAAAALLLALFTPQATETSSAQRDSVAELVTSASTAQAVQSVAAGPIDEAWLWSAAVGTDSPTSTTRNQ